MNLPEHLTRLPERYRWTPHNLLGHPLSEVLYLLGFKSLSNRVHDATVPARSSEPRG